MPTIKHMAGAFALLAGATLAQPALAAAYPERPISLLVGYSPGGPVDTSARVFARYLSEKIGQTVLVDNRPGASGMIAADATQKARPDGYTLNFVASPTMTMSPQVQRSTLFDPRTAFTPVGLVADYTNVLLVGPDFKGESVKDLIEYAKANPQEVSFGSAGIGASNHLSAELLKQTTGAPMLHVPYRGNSPAMVDVMGGKITFMFDITSTAKSFVESGKARALAVTSRERNPGLPDVPTMIEAGIPDYEVTGWYAVIGPRELPPEVIETLAAAMRDVNAEPGFREIMEKAGHTLHQPDGAALQQRVEREYALWQNVVDTAGIQPE
ncbi:tripartite tricarboxylate transporter substrate binding protein [Verticiella sediminum]|uniref:Tripartite tricarboxylate transporter substrate binding protein n=1 Tax=Verticiella sediminum TaxID=1247510 RepID=A0A556AYV3_9BURK|nr:tripartite tricarboxylate transporter substrate binding protein [Verticiella sediminum]TSH98117.1 tripartite tricarboxylate transporter substrate binding protein [Verticiella sediminum]